MDIFIDKVFKFSDEYEDIFLFGDKKQIPKLKEVSMKTKIIGDKRRENLYLFESKTLYTIKTKNIFTNNIKENLSELGFIVNLSDKDGFLDLRVFNPLNNIIYLSSDSIVAVEL